MPFATLRIGVTAALTELLIQPATDNRFNRPTGRI